MTTIDLDQFELAVRAALAADDLDLLRELLERQYPPDIADLIDRLDAEDQLRVFRQLDPLQAAEVLDETSVDTTRELILNLPDAEAADILEQLSADDAVAILTEDVPERRDQLLAEMEPEDAADVRTLLSYPPQSAGRLMVESFMRLQADSSVGMALDLLRDVGDEIETINYLYVVDRRGRLEGVISLRELIVAPSAQRVGELMETQLITVEPEIDQEEVARIVARYDLAAVPVVDTQRRILGIVTVDDVIDILVEEHTEDALKFAGVQQGQADETYFTTSIFTVVRRRVVWLLLLFVGGSFTANVLGLFEAQLSQVVALTFFIPLLIGTGGNTGAQTVSTLIRAMALREVGMRDVWPVIRRELACGIVLGVLLGMIALGRVLIDGHWFMLALTVSLSVVAICCWANVIGALVPLAARRFGVDPALVSAPLITTLVDATGLAIYLLIARSLLGI
ncbi:MAG TPA: magnesium transporter [Roseiflexaceae bacterium]|nr:magnesium transporter [Roseiflexaceae bacterium]HMP40458.1 magnesium transporter [Roseiflexaceae bacterium]